MDLSPGRITEVSENTGERVDVKQMVILPAPSLPLGRPNGVTTKTIVSATFEYGGVVLAASPVVLTR